MTPPADSERVRDLISPSLVSRTLHLAGVQRNEPIGHQARPFEPLPRTGGYQVRQNGPGWRAEVFAHHADDAARAETYERITAVLTAAGYDVDPVGQPSACLTVTRRRPPTPAEWAALEDLARSPRVTPPETAHELSRDGLDWIPADVLAALWRSELVTILASVPMMRSPDSDVRHGRGSLIGLTAAGAALLAARNTARAARATWALIAPEQRWPKERPALLDGDPGREAVDAARP